jgi:hypothetical protein
MTELFHYTTLKGCRGIIESNRLWATRSDCLNDTSETTVYKQPFAQEIRSAIFKICESSDKPYDVDKEVGIFIDAHHEAFCRALGDIFITSFCKHNNEFIRQHGLLSMWRSYADGGVALVLDEEKLNEDLKNCFNCKVEYISDNSERHYVKAAGAFFHNLESSHIDHLIKDKNFIEAMRNMTVGCKHYGFHEEIEHRYIVSDSTRYEEKIYTNNDGKTKIYIELRVNITKDLVKEIIVGPGRLQTENHKAIIAMTKDLNIKITKSGIPYQ